VRLGNHLKKHYSIKPDYRRSVLIQRTNMWKRYALPSLFANCNTYCTTKRFRFMALAVTELQSSCHKTLYYYYKVNLRRSIPCISWSGRCRVRQSEQWLGYTGWTAGVRRRNEGIFFFFVTASRLAHPAPYSIRT